MGVYIPNMEMPASCRKCMISQPDGCGWICPIIENKPIVDFRVNSRHPHCHLVPVPPHGRLGDLDALLKKCEFVCTDDDEDTRAVRYSIIEDAPTIIPAEPAEEGE